MASIDFYINETTRHANIILPPTAALEHDNYDLAFHILAIRNTAKYSLPLFAPGPNTRHDWQIFLELQTRMESKGFGSGIWAKAKRAFVSRFLPPSRMLDLALRLGLPNSRLQNSNALRMESISAHLRAVCQNVCALLRNASRWRQSYSGRISSELKQDSWQIT
jgi:anaerobic selenocysteine-containing dehydrogenase